MTTKVLTDSEIAGAAKAAGFSGQALSTIVAIALAESSGNMYAHNKIPPDNSYGLTQVNMLGDMGPARRKEFGLKSNEELFDPVTNFKAAYKISGGGKNFRPWSTYTSGAYFLYLPRARKASGSPSATVPGTGSGSASQVGIVSGTADAFEFLTEASTWKRLGYILAGSALILFALVKLSASSDIAKTAVNVATTVVPVGRVAKAAKVAA